MKHDNKLIQRTLKRYLKRMGKKDTRKTINTFAKHFKTSKQVISGNLSYLVCIEEAIIIIKNKPYSEMEICV